MFGWRCKVLLVFFLGQLVRKICRGLINTGIDLIAAFPHFLRQERWQKSRRG